MRDRLRRVRDRRLPSRCPSASSTRRRKSRQPATDSSRREHRFAPPISRSLLMLFHVVTLIMGVFFTVRKLDVRRREAKDYPNVDPAAFQEWKSTALRAYNLGAFACFGRVALDVANQYALSRVAPWTVIQV